METIVTIFQQKTLMIFFSFFFFPPMENLDYFFFLNGLLSDRKSFCHKIDYQLCFFLLPLMPKKGLS